MACGIWFSISELEGSQGARPAGVRIHQIGDRLTGLLKEDVIMINPSGSFESRTKPQLPLQDSQCSGAELDPPIFTGLG
jgi:hypothetical protein